MKVGFILAATILIVSSSSVNAACKGDVAISAQHDLDQIRSCKTYVGNIKIDNSGVADLKLNGVELLEGDLTITNNSALQNIAFPRLQGVNGQIKFANNKLLNSIDIRQLYALRNFEVSIHPALNELRFGAGLSQAEKITITDTTCTKIEGFKMSSAKEIEISNNIYLKNLNFGNMSSVNTVLIAANSPSLKVDLNQIESLRDATFRNVATVSLGSLKKVTGDISFISNSFDTLDLPTTTNIAGTFTIVDNINLSNVSVPKLTRLGGALSIGGNSKLASVSGFPELQQIEGTLDLTGGFDEVQLPALADVRGGLNIQTSSNSFSCDGINRLQSGVIKGNLFTCKSAVAKPKSNIRGGNGKGGSGDSSVGSGAASVGGSLLTAFGAAALAYMINI